jgi:hypothetical protein
LILTLETSFHMARAHIPEEASAFYPPRARWYSSFIHLGYAWRRRMALDRLVMPQDLRLDELIAGFLVPGLAVWLRGPRIWGQAALAGSAALCLVFMIWMGYPVANLAMGLLISLHSSGFVYYWRPVLAKKSFRCRLGFSILSSMVIGLLLYTPGRILMQEYLLMPLRMNDQVFVVQRISRARYVQQGDRVAYALHEVREGEGEEGGAVQAHAGMGIGPVLAVSGDQIEFSTSTFSVNGVSYAALPYMPHSGALTVPENHWLIWPRLDMSREGHVRDVMIGDAFLELASVSHTQYLGRPFHHWFWRKQF